MSKAGIMFKELGYEPFYEKFYGGYYFRETDGRKIAFWHYWAIGDDADNEVIIETRRYEEEGLTVQEHLAIHEKMSELGWLS